MASTPDPEFDPAMRRRLRRRIAARRRELASLGDGAYLALWQEVCSGAFGPVPAGQGWFHEDFHQADKADVFARARGGGRIAADDVVAASRLYTPLPIVDLILQNTLGALWCRMHPDSAVAGKWTHLERRAIGVRTTARPLRELRLVDPCCGAGAFLCRAFDMLEELAACERTMGLPWALSRAEAPVHILHHMLWGADLDDVAVAIARRELSARAGGVDAINVRSVTGPLGSLSPTAFDDDAFDVVVTNPPWIGFRQLDPQLKQHVRAAVGDCGQDLAVAMQTRCLDLVAEGGRVGTITPAAWFTGRDTLPLRERILAVGGPAIVARLGQGVFADAPLVFTGVSIVDRGDFAQHVEVADGRAGPEAQQLGEVMTASRAVPRSVIVDLPLKPFAPAVPAEVISKGGGGPKLGQVASTFDGVWTGDNRRDLRMWWESPGDGWVPISGGQGYRPWCAPTYLRIRAEHVAAQPSRAGCLEYARVAGGRLGVRVAADGVASLAGVVTIVPCDDDPHLTALIMAVCNTRLGAAWVTTLTAGLNFNPGYLARIPLPAERATPQLMRAVAAVVDAQRIALTHDPSHDGFVAVPSPWADEGPDEPDLSGSLAQIETELLRMSGLHEDALARIAMPRATRAPVTRLDDLLLVGVLRALGMRWPGQASARQGSLRRDEVCDVVRDTLRAAHAPDGAVDAAAWVRDRLDVTLRRRFRRVPPACWSGAQLQLTSPRG